MNQGASLQETIAKGKRHYYDGLTFRKWKSGMLTMYGHDTTPFLDEAWNAISGEAESRARANRGRYFNDNRESDVCRFVYAHVNWLRRTF